MAFVSYAQNLEDVMLFRALKHVSRGFYIDVGAGHPTDDSVTKAFYDRGWRGINIEPSSEFFELLCLERPEDINLNVLAARQDGIRPFFEIKGTGLSTVNEAYAERYRADGRQVIEHSIRCLTLDSICRDYSVRVVHFLKIDVEGAEEEVLQGLSLRETRPWIIVVEANAPNSIEDISAAWSPYLLERGYLDVYYDGLNRFFLAQEQQDLKANFKVPPNVFDGHVVASSAHRIVKLERALEQEKARPESAWNELELTLQRCEKAEQDLALEKKANQSLSQQLDAARSEISRLIGEITAIRQSFSWRLTAPVRLMGNVLIPFSSVRSLVRLLAAKAYRIVLRHPALRTLGIRAGHHFPVVKKRFLALARGNSEDHSVYATVDSEETLTEPARTVLWRLKEACREKQPGTQTGGQE